MIKKGTSQKSKCLKRNKSTCGLVEKGTSLAIEDGEELRAGEGAGVSAGGTEGTEDAGGAAVLGRGDLAEVIKRPVEDVAVDVVDLHAGCARTLPNLPKKMVTAHAPVASQERIARVAQLGMDGWHKADMGRAESVAVKPEENTVTRSKQRGAFGVASGK